MATAGEIIGMEEVDIMRGGGGDRYHHQGGYNGYGGKDYRDGGSGYNERRWWRSVPSSRRIQWLRRERL